LSGIPSKDSQHNGIYSEILAQIESDFAQYNGEIKEAYKQFRIGEKLILNNEAVVEWVGVSEIERKVDLLRLRFSRRNHRGNLRGLPFQFI